MASVPKWIRLGPKIHDVKSLLHPYHERQYHEHDAYTYQHEQTIREVGICAEQYAADHGHRHLLAPAVEHVSRAYGPGEDPDDKRSG